MNDSLVQVSGQYWLCFLTHSLPSCPTNLLPSFMCNARCLGPNIWLLLLKHSWCRPCQTSPQHLPGAATHQRKADTCSAMHVLSGLIAHQFIG